MLTTNDRIIKLWKFEHKNLKKQSSKCYISPDGQIVFPKSEVVDEGYESCEKKQFKHCHNYNINSMSVSPDGQNFLSADDLRINLWNLENSITAFNLVDIKPPDI